MRTGSSTSPADSSAKVIVGRMLTSSSLSGREYNTLYYIKYACRLQGERGQNSRSVQKISGRISPMAPRKRATSAGVFQWEKLSRTVPVSTRAGGAGGPGARSGAPPGRRCPAPPGPRPEPPRPGAPAMKDSTPAWAARSGRAYTRTPGSRRRPSAASRVSCRSRRQMASSPWLPHEPDPRQQPGDAGHVVGARLQPVRQEVRHGLLDERGCRCRPPAAWRSGTPSPHSSTPVPWGP